MTEMNLTGPREQLFNPDVRAELDSWIVKYPVGKAQSALIPGLHILQEANGGWLPQPVMNALATYLDIPTISVYEVATFYSMFDLSPVGQHKLNICTNISCMLCGSEDILAHIEKRLQIKPGETTADGLITLREVECLGACVGAPMLQFDKSYHEFLTIEKVDVLLDEILSCN